MKERKKIIYKKEGLEGRGNQRTKRKKTGKQGNVVGDREKKKKKKEKYRI